MRAVLAVLGVLAVLSAEAAPRPPDILLITIDTLRADALGFAGNANVKTPFLDRMATEGIVFNNAHAQNVVTLPSHANILTGLYPYQHGIRDNAGFKLDAKYETAATSQRRAGNTTGAFVGAFPLDARFGLNQGFDVYDDNYGKGAASLDFAMQERSAAAVLDSAVHWWETNEGRKRFLWVHLYDPHAPYRPPAPFDAVDDPYLGEIASVDDALAKAFDPIIGANRNVLLIVTADHGEARGDHGELTHGLFAYEATLKVPLIVRPSPGPSGHPLPPSGRGEDAYVRHIDILPTILEAAGIEKPASLPGASLLGAIGPRDTYFEALSASINRGWAPLTGIIHGGAKYIDLPVAELYDLPRDPGEKTNLRAERRRDVEAARKLLPARGATSRSVSAEEAAQLRSLGYLGGSGSTKTTFTAADDPKNLVALDTKMHDVVDAYERRDLPRALKLAKEVVATRPDMAAGRELLAFVLQQQEQVGEAIANLRAAMKSGQQTEGIRVQLALLLTETGKTDEAVKLLEPLASGTNPDALNAYGVALADQGKLDEADALFQRVLQLDANNAPALQNLGIVALRRDDVGAAQANLARALALNPRLPLALNTMGVVFARQNDFAQAVEMWKRAVEIDPRQYDALFNTGLVEARAGHAAEARAALERFRETAPKSRYGKDIETARQVIATLR